MKKFILTILLAFTFSLFAQEVQPQTPEAEDSTTEEVVISEPTPAEANVKEKNTDWKSNPFIKFFIDPWYTISFNEGASYAQVTRIEILDDRSNFVRENFMVGLFCNMKTDNLCFLDFVVQLNAYYPYYYTFNGMRQFPKNQILYAADSYLGTVYSIDFLKYVLIDISLGMHFMYQLSDEYHLCYLGLGTLNTIEFPITKTWTIVNNYFFSYDNANLGSNKNVQKFNASYQYHIDLGVRYSRRTPNAYYYIDTDKIKANMKAKKQARLEAKRNSEVIYK